MNTKFIKVAILLAAAAAVAWGIRHHTRGRHDGPLSAVRVSGNIEVTDARVSFKIAGRVTERLVSEGEKVVRGQRVAVLDKTELEQELALRKAEQTAAEAVLAELEAGSRPEDIEEAAAALELARAESKRQASEFARQSELFKSQAIPVRDYEAADAANSMAIARVREATARFERLKKGPREETIRAARARLEQVRQAVGLAETRLGYAELTSPMAGLVLSQDIENGEYVVPGAPVITVANLEQVWLRAFIDESDLGRVKTGCRARVTTDTWPDKRYEGRVTFISDQAEFTPKNVQTAKERVKLVYRIKVALPNPDGELKPGMPADAEITPE